MITQGGLVACKQTPPSRYPSSKSPINASGVSDDDASSGSAKTSGSRKRRMSSVGTVSEINSPSSKMQNEDRLSHKEHRALIEAIFEVGLKNASPAVILENMTSTPECITSERVKSHLQKYRHNRVKAKEDFMASYDQWMSQVIPDESDTSDQQLPSPAALLGMMNSTPLGAGEMAASLTYSVLMNDTSIFSLGKVEAFDVDIQEGMSSDDYMSHLSSGAALNFPTLTKAEEESSVGIAMLHVQSMFVAITAQVEFQRGKSDQVKVSERLFTGLPSTVDTKVCTPDRGMGQVALRPQSVDKALGSDVSNQRGTPGKDKVAQSLKERVEGIDQDDRNLQGKDSGAASRAETQPGKSEKDQLDRTGQNHDKEVASDVVKDAKPEIDGKCAASSRNMSDMQALPARVPIRYQPSHYAHPVESFSPQNQHMQQQQQLIMLHQHHHQQRHHFHLHQLRLRNRAPPWSNSRPLPPPPGRFGPPPPYHNARDSPRSKGS